MSKHEIRWYDNTGALQRVISNFTSLDYVKTVNTVGAMDLTIPLGNYDFTDFSTDVILEIWRETSGEMRLQNETTYFLLDWEIYNDGQADLVRLLAKDANFLLSTRIVAYASGTSQAEKSDYADDMMKEVVKENMGSSASSGRQFSNFSIDGDFSASEEIDKAFAWRNVLTVCEDICKMAKDKGTNTYFEIVRPQPGYYVFKTYVDYRGVDHGSESSDIRPVGVEYQNLSNPTLKEIHSSQISSFVIGGQGQASERSTVTYSPTEFGYYRNTEGFIDARNTQDSNILDDLKYEKFEEHNYKRIVSGYLSETKSMRYGIDFDFGDVLAVEAFGYNVDCHVDSVAVRVDNKGKEERNIYLEGEL